jgi:hypothetical protein
MRAIIGASTLFVAMPLICGLAKKAGVGQFAAKAYGIKQAGDWCGD